MLFDTPIPTFPLDGGRGSPVKVGMGLSTSIQRCPFISKMFAPLGAASAKTPVQVEGSAKQAKVSKGLREVAERLGGWPHHLKT